MSNMYDDLINDVLVLRDETVASRRTIASIDLATYEMQEIYKEREPYTTRRLITGIDYIFGDVFIDKVRYAMSTDSLDLMNNSELEVWEYFVQFEDEFSTSADEVLYPDAIGCTIPDGNGQSFVVTEQGITTDLCQTYPSELLAIDLAKALDKKMVDLVNCQDDTIVDTGLKDLVNVSTSCTL